MRHVCSLFAIAGLAAGCALDPHEDATRVDDVDDASAATVSQAITTPTACFVDLGQPNPSNTLSRRFDSTCSTPATGSSITLRTWSYGDNVFALPGATVTDHVYPATNTCYKVTLTVFDANGATASTSRYATFCAVGPCNPVCPP